MTPPPDTATATDTAPVRYLSRKAAAAYLNISPRTFQKFAREIARFSTSAGRTAKHCYDIKDLDAFVASRKQPHSHPVANSETIEKARALLCRK